ncbi:aromatic compound dioxygenase [Auriculariales sp. MPI-PUGE-AT-0066]|nr:aromatic compound dioxygenase [Auriculariales sp. MPI-PUGE-AT-0066]
MFSQLLFVSALVASVLGHGDHDEPADTALFRRSNLNEHRDIHKRCESTLQFIQKRRLARRGLVGPETRDEDITPAALCTMVGQTTEGPYYVNNELFRDDVTDGQEGVPLQLKLTIMDVETCDILPNAFVEIWSTNSTGSYSGFTLAGGGGGPPGGGNPPPPPPTSTDTTSSTSTTTMGPFDGADTPGGGGPPGQNATDNLTFMRGVTQADDNGEAIFYANVPGWYQGRAVHIHIRVFENSTVADNGTFVSASGTLHHTGQLYFEQELVDNVATLPPYSTNSLPYENATRNDEDGIYPFSTYGGYNPNLATTLLGETLDEGILGEIVITINRTYTSPMRSTAYHTRRFN